MLRTVKDKLVACAPEHFTVEFGVKLGGESGIILAKGTAEVNLKITMTWDRDNRTARCQMAGYETAIVRVRMLAPWAGRQRAWACWSAPCKLVTCAHVVNAALGRDQREQAHPGESEMVQVEFPLLPGYACAAGAGRAVDAAA